MKIEKCKYLNNHRTCCSLMIDDLVPIAVSRDNDIGPDNDWGFMMNKPGSLMAYMEKQLFSKYPEIRGTLFIPTSSHEQVQNAGAYLIHKGDFDAEFKAFLAGMYPRFELAYHGTYHTREDPQSGSIQFEHAASSQYDTTATNKTVKLLESINGDIVTGGKFPGYRYCPEALKMISQEFKWWALDSGMMNRKHPGNTMQMRGSLVIIPTNISGNAFIENERDLSIRDRIKRIVKDRYYRNPLSYLKFLYRQRLPITIQEHAQNQRTDGKRQTPNLFDDLFSLERIFSYLRGKDVWYATCSELAHYHDSYVQSIIEIMSDDSFKLSYTGMWDAPLLSLKLDCAKIVNLDTEAVIQGNQVNDGWMFKISKSGKFRTIV